MVEKTQKIESSEDEKLESSLKHPRRN